MKANSKKSREDEIAAAAAAEAAVAVGERSKHAANVHGDEGTRASGCC